VSLSRRAVLRRTLLGAGGLGLRALATGLPLSFLLDPARALADGLPACGDQARAQFFILATSGNGDPVNANVPGCYLDGNITHSADPAMAPTALTLAGHTAIAARPWSTLPQAVLDRTSFWHLMTNTPVHPKETEVLRLMGAIRPAEMLPSLLSRSLASCLGTVQAQPITLGATSPSEGLTYAGAALPILPPLSLKATLATPAGGLGNLQALRATTLDQLADVLRTSATSAQRRYLDGLVSSQRQIREVNQSLLASLDSITDNGVASQLTAALALIQMKVTPVVAIHIPFGGDNHNDTALAAETAQTVSGVAAIASLMSRLQAAGLSDQVSFLSLNVFGRTLGPASTNGRQHNPNHQVSIAIGKPFRGGVIGGLAPVANDYGALPLDSASGQGRVGGDVAAIDTLAAFGKTVLASVGLPDADLARAIPNGKVVGAALS
jgi:hypothetical protein